MVSVASASVAITAMANTRAVCWRGGGAWIGQDGTGAPANCANAAGQDVPGRETAICLCVADVSTGAAGGVAAYR